VVEAKLQRLDSLEQEFALSVRQESRKVEPDKGDLCGQSWKWRKPPVVARLLCSGSQICVAIERGKYKEW
jgi:hypothetical protein